MSKTSDSQIEIEFRSMFGRKKYDDLKKFLDKNAQDLGEDDKDVHFFIMADKLLKVVDNVSQKNAKLVLKLSKIGKGSDFEEIEIPISQIEVRRAVKMFKALGLTDNIMHSFQKRHNYLYKGVELALKYSDVWKHHLELEVMIDSRKKKAVAEKRIQEVADELGVRLMTDQELVEFTRRAEKKYQKEKRSTPWRCPK